MRLPYFVLFVPNRDLKCDIQLAEKSSFTIKIESRHF